VGNPASPLISDYNGGTAHPDSPLGKAIREAEQELAEETHKARVAVVKERIRARRARPWWKRVLPFTIQIHWN
jgi:hypothetical protein